MRALRLGLAAFIVIAIPLLAAAPAHAVIIGPCEGTGSFSNGGPNVDAKTMNRADIPRKASVSWEGKVGTGTESGKHTYNGEVNLKFPPLIDKLIPSSIQPGKWGGESDKYSKSGVYKYKFPSVLAGIDFEVSGFHNDGVGNCTGHITLHIKGGGLKNPAAIASLVVTAISGASLVISARMKKGAF